MKFDFDKIVERKSTSSMKWEVPDGVLPMWVGDMDFETAPCVSAAVQKRAQNGAFGYTVVPDGWYGAITAFWQKHFGFTIEREWLAFCTGVVPAISSMVKRLSNVGDEVVVFTPAYDIFFHSIENAGRHVSEVELAYADGKYSIDFAALEEKLRSPIATLMIFCNPQNPSGNIWTAEELARVGELCAKHGVTVISDEIHCLLTDPSFTYTPFAAASEICKSLSVTCISASKAFNLGGMQSAAVFASNAALREKVVRGINSDEVAEPNCFAVCSTVAAFTQGEEWLTQLREYLRANKAFAAAYIGANVKNVRVVPQNATYFLWIDCGSVTCDADRLQRHILDRTGLRLCGGAQYRGNGKAFLRMNVACPQALLKDGLKRFKEGIESFKNQ